jgi:predicted transcriptional regulator
MRISISKKGRVAMSKQNKKELGKEIDRSLDDKGFWISEGNEQVIGVLDLMLDSAIEREEAAKQVLEALKKGSQTRFELQNSLGFDFPILNNALSGLIKKGAVSSTGRYYTGISKFSLVYTAEQTIILEALKKGSQTRFDLSVSTDLEFPVLNQAIKKLIKAGKITTISLFAGFPIYYKLAEVE